MADLDRPVTLRDLRDLRVELRFEFRSELERLATKAELEAGLATLRTANEDLRSEMASGFAEVRGYVDFSVKSQRDELRTHFDVVAESLRSDLRNMFDWMKANMAGVTSRLDALEKRRN